MSVSIAPFTPAADFSRLIRLAGACATLRSTHTRTWKLSANRKALQRPGEPYALSVYTLVLLFLRCLALTNYATDYEYARGMMIPTTRRVA